jgi:hypothetical protein
MEKRKSRSPPFELDGRKISPDGDQSKHLFITKSIIMKNQNSNAPENKPHHIDINPKNNTATAKAAEKSTEVQDHTSAKSLGAVDHVSSDGNGQKKSDVSNPIAGLNLESTLKLVEELHRRMVQRGRLVHTIDNLDKFEIEQKEDAEDSLSNYYQGCELEITDDKRNKFSTKNPVIIKAVALYVRQLCTNRLAEIEAEITIPV